MIDEHQVDPFLRLTAGVTVYTDDGDSIGSVKEISGRYFRVAAGLFKRDFWLPAECIDEVVAGEPVILRISKDELDDQKLANPPDLAG